MAGPARVRGGSVRCGDRHRASPLLCALTFALHGCALLGYDVDNTDGDGGGAGGRFGADDPALQADGAVGNSDGGSVGTGGRDELDGVFRYGSDRAIPSPRWRGAHSGVDTGAAGYEGAEAGHGEGAERGRRLGCMGQPTVFSTCLPQTC